MANKRTTFSCFQSALSLTDTVPIGTPVWKAFLSALVTSVPVLRFAAAQNEV